MHAHLNSPHSVRRKVTTWRVTWFTKSTNVQASDAHAGLLLHRAPTQVQMGSGTSRVFRDCCLWMHSKERYCSQVTGALTFV